jgi:hypothetical protein
VKTDGFFIEPFIGFYNKPHGCLYHYKTCQ